MDAFLKFLNSYSVIITIASVMVIAFARTIIKIFRLGVTFKTELATKEEQRVFEEEVRKDMRAYSVQIQKLVTDSVMTVLNNKMADVESAKDAITEIKVMKAEIDAEIKNALDRLDEMKVINDSVRALGNKVSRIEQQQNGNGIQSSERRREG